jgi:hypothetical protein
MYTHSYIYTYIYIQINPDGTQVVGPSMGMMHGGGVPNMHGGVPMPMMGGGGHLMGGHMHAGGWPRYYGPDPVLRDRYVCMWVCMYVDIMDLIQS